jgi:hypothetical protein
MNKKNSPDSKLSFRALKKKQREIREGFSDSLGLRVHRALSWLQRAEKETEDTDAAFIFYWIAFNAAYANEVALPEAGERLVYQDYFEQLTKLDGAGRIYGTIWDRYSQEIRLLLENRFVFQPFWNQQNSIPHFEDWEKRFERSRRAVARALGEKSTSTVLSILFDRLYVLRNQLIHGGATWGSSVNRDQVRDGRNILASLVPIFVDLMMDHPEVDWGRPYYPVLS